ncbi:dnaJ homolog subfamily C member 13-like, partial [Nycticebus coucang]|uniref:dnaJ homolog subfamily C member 13-like n=1 Tax=Nycticebus coucang TaxID=9470 RepID=UPI00234C4F4F
RREVGRAHWLLEEAPPLRTFCFVTRATSGKAEAAEKAAGSDVRGCPVNPAVSCLLLDPFLRCLHCRLPEDFAVVFGEAEGKLAVGGVFLRIFIAQPAWVLTKPGEFLSALLEKLTELLEKNNPHPQLVDQVPPLGHLPKVI